MAGAMTFRRAFENKAFNIEDAAAEQCAQLAQTNSLDPSAFVQQFELFAIKRHAVVMQALTHNICTEYSFNTPHTATTTRLM